MLWIGLAPIESVVAGTTASRATLDALPSSAEFDAVVLGAKGGSLLDACVAARACARDGGVLALVLPIERAGLAALSQRALGIFDAARRPRPLEDACAALLEAGVSPVKVIDVEGAGGHAVVHGAVRRHPEAQAASR